jgi:tetratricopeptide (TPR) repeat protein
MGSRRRANRLNIVCQVGAAALLLFGTLHEVRAETPPSPLGWVAAMQRGIEARAAGALLESIDRLTVARNSATSQNDRLLASAALGASFLQAQRLQEAEQALGEAYAGMGGVDKGRVANDLGNLAFARKDSVRALKFYEQARTLGHPQAELHLVASLNVVRLSSKQDRAALLGDLLPHISQVPDRAVRARLLLNLAQQSSELDRSGLARAYDAYMQAIRDGESVQAQRIVVEALDALAQLYEVENRFDDAQTLNQRALKTAANAPVALVQDILIRLEWRQSRLLKATGRLDDALAAMQRAATHLEVLRQDLPIEVEGGTTSFASLLRPIYVGLADLILLRQSSSDVGHRQAAAMDAISILELSRQAELQDYLGERCSVLSATGGNQPVPAGTAVLYPLVLEDRIELLVKWSGGASYRTVKTSAATLKRLSADMADGLRSYDNDDFLSPAQQLYNLLVLPVEGDLDAAQTNTLIIASEGFLRPIPFAALHDGQKFLIEKFALATVTGMSMTDQTLSDRKSLSSLLVGLAEPGTAVDKLEPSKFMGVAQVAKANLRSLNLADSKTVVRDALRLPGVTDEMRSLGQILSGARLLNDEFSVDRFSTEASTGNYRILHIASHGIFGGDASSSFILASDDVLSMNGLQSILRSDNLKRSPIELLTLSACETAEGNDRAPLGFSGAAIKARARSVLGTLWPVVDDAAQKVMTRFYGEFVGNQAGKAAALRQAQVALLIEPATNHPFYWAPFTLVGNWQ